MELDPLLATLTDGASAALGDDLLGVYRVGSFALDAGTEQDSVGFLAVTNDRLRPDQTAALDELHASLAHLPASGARGLEGSYAPAVDLRSPMSIGRSWPYLGPGAAALTSSDHDNTLHARWLVREHAVAVVGPRADTFVAPVDAGALRAEMIGLSRARAEEVEEHPERLAGQRYQRSLVLTLCCALHTTYTGRVPTSADAAAWALTQVPREHHEVIVRALAGRRAADDDLVAPTRAFAWEMHRLIGAEALRLRTP